MKPNSEIQSALTNRLSGLAILIVTSASCWYWPPSRLIATQRGLLGIAQDLGMGAGNGVMKVKLAFYWGLVMLAMLLGSYQAITGRRASLPGE